MGRDLGQMHQVPVSSNAYVFHPFTYVMLSAHTQAKVKKKNFSQLCQSNVQILNSSNHHPSCAWNRRTFDVNMICASTSQVTAVFRLVALDHTSTISKKLTDKTLPLEGISWMTGSLCDLLRWGTTTGVFFVGGCSLHSCAGIISALEQHGTSVIKKWFRLGEP